MMHPLATVPNRQWNVLPKSSAQATKLGRKYFYTGEPCRNGHVALSKVKAGCIICLGMQQARAEVRLHERIAQREADREGPVRRVMPVRANTAEGRVLMAIAEHGGALTQVELVDRSKRGMGQSIVSRAFRSLLHRKLLKHDGRMYRLTLEGVWSAQELGVVGPIDWLREAGRR